MSKRSGIPKWITASAVLGLVNWLIYLPDTVDLALERWPEMIESADWLMVKTIIFTLAVVSTLTVVVWTLGHLGVMLFRAVKPKQAGPQVVSGSATPPTMVLKTGTAVGREVPATYEQLRAVGHPPWKCRWIMAQQWVKKQRGGFDS